MLKLVFYVPETHAEQVKEAVFAAGAGKIGLYDKCCWQVAGRGQFRPLAGSNPHLGETGELETVDEFRVELVCEEALIKKAIAALREAHPYEEPAFDVMQTVAVE